MYLLSLWSSHCKYLFPLVLENITAFFDVNIYMTISRAMEKKKKNLNFV